MVWGWEVWPPEGLVYQGFGKWKGAHTAILPACHFSEVAELEEVMRVDPLQELPGITGHMWDPCARPSVTRVPLALLPIYPGQMEPRPKP